MADDSRPNSDASARPQRDPREMTGSLQRRSENESRVQSRREHRLPHDYDTQANKAIHHSQRMHRTPSSDARRGARSSQDPAQETDFRYIQQTGAHRDSRRGQQRRGRPDAGAQRGAKQDRRKSRSAVEAQSGARSSVSNKERARSAAAAAAAASKAQAKQEAKAAKQSAKEKSGAMAAAAAASKSAAAASSSSSASGASEYASDRYKARNAGMSTRKKIIIGVVCVLVIALAGCGVAAAIWYNNITNNMKGSSDITTLSTPVADEPYYMLLMGSDSREGWEWEPDNDDDTERADSIMVARIDEREKKVSIISVPRDLRVNIKGHGYHKINTTIEYGGYDLLITTLNDILGIKINYYATVHFKDFMSLVDTLGGVRVEVPEGTSTYGGEIILPAGEDVLLNGDEALILARCRHGWPMDQGVYAMGDYQRTLNQRNLIKAIAKEVLQQDITMMPSLIETLSKCIETNMSVDKIIALAQAMRGMDIESMEAAQLPIGASTIGGEWEALMYQDVYELMDANFKNGDPLFQGLDNFNSEANDDDVHGNYIDGPLYAYTTYSAKYGSPYSDGFTPNATTQEAISQTKQGISHADGSTGQ